MSEKPKGPSKAMKPDGRLARPYRIMWCDDSGGGAGDYQPPITSEKPLQISFGGLDGTPVDAYVATIGPCAGTPCLIRQKSKAWSLSSTNWRPGPLSLAATSGAWNKTCATCGWRDLR